MNIKYLLGFLLLAIFSCGVADDAASPLKVDLTAVVESGAVKPVDGISTAAQPSEAALQVFAEQGYTTVIDLRGVGEDRGFDEEAAVEALNMDYLAFPISGREAISFENAARLSDLIENAKGPVLLHCASSNRVGALLALRQSLAGADDEEALAVGRRGGLTSLETRVKEVLADENRP